MKNILILIGSFCYNKGSEALVKGTIAIIKKYIPDSFITVCSGEESFGAHLSVDGVDRYVRRQSYYSGFSLNRIKAHICKSVFRNEIAYNKIKYKDVVNAGKSADLIIVLGGDNYDQSYHMYDLMHTVNDLLRQNSKAKMVMYDCSLDEKEINDDVKKDFALFDAVTARETDTYQAFLENFRGMNIKYYPDPAFVMESEKIKLPDGFETGNTIGVNVSSMVMDEQYGSSASGVLNAYKKMLLWILENTEHKIMLIPHVMRNLDLSALRKLYELFKDRERVFLVENEGLSARELKYIISQCVFYVGARTHSTIAAYSTNVPTLVLGYSIKSVGIARDLFGTEKGYVVSTGNLIDDEVLTKTFVELYGKKDEIRKKLKNEIMPSYIEKAWKAGELFRDLVEGKK